MSTQKRNRAGKGDIRRPRLQALAAGSRRALTGDDSQSVVDEHITEPARTEAAPVDDKRRLEAALIAGEVGTCDWDLKTDRFWGNENFARLYDVQVDSDGTAPHSAYIAAVHPDDRERVGALVKRTLETGCNYEAEYRVRGKDGRERWVLIRCKAERDGAGRVVGFPGVVLDITRLKRAEEALRRSEERLQLAADMVGLCPYEWNLPAGQPVWGARQKQIWGLPPDAHVDGELFMSAIHPDDRPAVEAATARALDPKGDGRYAAEYRVIGIQDGVERWVTARARAFFHDGKPVDYIGTVMEITERKRLETEVLEASEGERRRIGQDLHDDLCQRLTSIALTTRLLQQRLARRAPEAAAVANEIVQAAQQATARARELAKGLHPVRLEADGLAAALRELAANVETQFRVPCRFHLRDTRAGARVIDPAVAIQLYRIAQEAATNSAKHGNAKNISISLSVVKGRLKLSVADDGVGIADVRPAAGMGLPIMNQRARAIGAALTISRGRRGGTLVTCSLSGEPKARKARERR